MKCFAVLLLLFSPLASRAQTQLYFEENQALTRAVPTTSPVGLPASPSKPLLLSGWSTYRLTVCPELGCALTGGSIRLYVFNRYVMGTGRWGYRPELDKRITITGNVANMCQTYGLQTDVRTGYLLPATIGVTTTCGTTATVRVDPDNY